MCVPLWAGTVVTHVGWDSGVCVPMCAGIVVKPQLAFRLSSPGCVLSVGAV